MIIYAGVDGTSTLNEEAYKESYRNSFVNRLSRNELVHFSDAFYHRGPFLPGLETAADAQMAFTWVVTRWKAGQAKAIFLAGHSRGAAAVIEVASWLKPMGIPVECLILFDAVDKSTPGPGGGVGGIFKNTKIADNVRQTIHPMRNADATGSRKTFGSCGQRAENPRMPFYRQMFFATHSSVGGVPWKVAKNPFTGVPRDTIWEDGEPWPTSVTTAVDHTGSAVVQQTVFPMIRTAYEQCAERLKEKPYIPAPPEEYPGRNPSYIPPSESKPGSGQRTHVVQPGDWLSKIAVTYYGDMNKWTVIYNHPQNRQTIGPNPDLIKPGQSLVIP